MCVRVSAQTTCGGSETSVKRNTNHALPAPVAMGLHVEKCENAWGHVRRGGVRAWRTFVGVAAYERGGVRAWRRTSVLQRTSVRAYERTSVRAYERTIVRAYERTSVRAYERPSVAEGMRGGVRAWLRNCTRGSPSAPLGLRHRSKPRRMGSRSGWGEGRRRRRGGGGAGPKSRALAEIAGACETAPGAHPAIPMGLPHRVKPRFMKRRRGRMAGPERCRPRVRSQKSRGRANLHPRLAQYYPHIADSSVASHDAGNFAAAGHFGEDGPNDILLISTGRAETGGGGPACIQTLGQASFVL